MDTSTVYCEFELARFPVTDFYRDTKGRHVHRTEPLHTVDGYVISDGDLPTPPTLVRELEGDEGQTGHAGGGRR